MRLQILHFTKELLKQIEDMGVNIARVTLHVGLGTFQMCIRDSSSGRWHFQRRLVQDSRREKSCAGGIFENGAAAFDDGRANCMGLIYY